MTNETVRQERALVLEMVNRIALDILASRTGIEALRRIVETAQMLVSARYAALGVARVDGTGISEFVTAGMTSEQEAAIGSRPIGTGVLGLLLQRNTPLRIDSLSDHPASVGFPSNHPSMKSFLGVPIRRGDTVVGSLYLTDKENGTSFTEADEAAVEALGAYAAVAVHNLQLLTRQRALVSGLIAAQEEERRAVAYDLHDGLTQYVMAAHAHLEAFKRAQSSGKAERADRELDQGMRYLKDAVVESRRLVNGLRSLALDDLGLAGALEQLAEEERVRAGWQEIDFLHSVAGARYHKTLETTIYRVAQEALTNVRKHAQTSHVRLSLLDTVDPITHQPQLVLEVRDWGNGFIPAQTERSEKHVGLHGMAERVQLIHGTFSIESAPGHGTCIRAVFAPLPPEPEARDEVTGEDL